ncbi:hypothetical protein Q9X98_004213 [Vibrio parahaemolyticus]|uniref:hypothetical protein n=1 Tax=Vibrio alginolyticus TaxID=663 RepID=UPI00211A9922|nr:hypothetical protein [Vibrio alginolyticus]ELA7322581.1 hypothetical protein [Vibrio parahaemolyticus]MCF9665098.1 hypothetical protein [Vibrio parahaemolyticus]MCR9484035.1 hypothetical protein [Vibrio alginolyticus]HCG9568361.1 hypothetical protein [Vibrio parahaemolyticus]
MKKLKVLALDPSLQNFGMVKGFIDIDDDDFPFTIEQMVLQESKGADKKTAKVVRKNSDDIRRAKSLHKALHEMLKDVNMVFVEVPVGSQSARSMASYGICVGIIASINKPMIQVTPTEVKLAAVGCKTASKQDMIDWATQAYPDAGWLTVKRNGKSVLTAKNEHLADAIGAVHAGILTDQFIQAVAILAAA